MTTTRSRPPWGALALAIIASSCAGQTVEQSGAVVVRPGAPGAASRVLEADEVRPPDRIVATDADVRFMQGMIPHHEQALTMSRLARTRTSSEALLLLADRIERSQEDEIVFLTQWLRSHGAEVPMAEHGYGVPSAPAQPIRMPGMLTEEELSALERATGEDFDRLFLTLMIRHHEGALSMVRQLFETEGAAEDPVVFEFAVGVDGDQRAEIGRMVRMLGGIQ